MVFEGGRWLKRNASKNGTVVVQTGISLPILQEDPVKFGSVRELTACKFSPATLARLNVQEASHEREGRSGLEPRARERQRGRRVDITALELLLAQKFVRRFNGGITG